MSLTSPLFFSIPPLNNFLDSFDRLLFIAKLTGHKYYFGYINIQPNIINENFNLENFIKQLVLSQEKYPLLFYYSDEIIDTGYAKNIVKNLIHQCIDCDFYIPNTFPKKKEETKKSIIFLCIFLKTLILFY